jgi:hypothetical protein
MTSPGLLPWTLPTPMIFILRVMNMNIRKKFWKLSSSLHHEQHTKAMLIHSECLHADPLNLKQT